MPLSARCECLFLLACSIFVSPPSLPLRICSFPAWFSAGKQSRLYNERPAAVQVLATSPFSAAGSSVRKGTSAFLHPTTRIQATLTSSRPSYPSFLSSFSLVPLAFPPLPSSLSPSVGGEAMDSAVIANTRANRGLSGIRIPICNHFSIVARSIDRMTSSFFAPSHPRARAPTSGRRRRLAFVPTTCFVGPVVGSTRSTWSFFLPS